MFMGNNNPLAGYYSLRWSVLKRDLFACQYCGAAAPQVMLHVDHREPKALGGRDLVENLVTACEACNIGRNLDHLRASVSESPKHPYLRELIRAFLLEYGPHTGSEIAKAIKGNRSNVASVLANDPNFVGIGKQGRGLIYGLA